MYVFCVNTATSHEVYDPLDVDQWDFYVISRSDIEQLGQRSMGLATVSRLGGQAVKFDKLGAQVASVAKT